MLSTAKRVFVEMPFSCRLNKFKYQFITVTMLLNCYYNFIIAVTNRKPEEIKITRKTVDLRWYDIPKTGLISRRVVNK